MSQISVVDADGHVTEPMSLWTDYVEPAYRERAPRPVLDERGRPCMLLDGRLVMRHAMLLTLGPDYDVAAAKCHAAGWDPQARLRDMDSEGIDLAVLFPSVAFYLPETSDPALTAALCRAYNDWLADYCRAAPSRLFGVAMLPLADVDAAIRELERATEKLGFRGAFVRPNPYAGRPIHHPAYERFWERAAALGVPVTVHEGLGDGAPGGRRLRGVGLGLSAPRRALPRRGERECQENGRRSRGVAPQDLCDQRAPPLQSRLTHAVSEVGDAVDGPGGQPVAGERG